MTNKEIDIAIAKVKTAYNEGQVERRLGSHSRDRMAKIEEQQKARIKRLQALDQLRSPRVIWN